MTMTHDQLHTHGPDELAMLRAECDKWHKAYDRVWEERMRFADRVIELEKEIKELKEKERKKEAEKEALLSDSVKRMIKNAEEGDVEKAHGDADDLLCEVLRKLGFDGLVNVFNCVEKWYA